MPLRKYLNEAKEAADIYFFETVVRIHRAGEGAAFTGLKPVGLSVGPVIPKRLKNFSSAKRPKIAKLCNWVKK